MAQSEEFDFVVIGSGFGGSVSAMRLAQKGYNVAIIEMGKRWKNSDFPKTNWNLKKYLWSPLIRCFGIQKISLLNRVMVLHGIGVGGGSLVYANTLMSPPEHVFRFDDWPAGLNWEKELAPHYQMAKKMLGVVENPILEEGEQAINKLGIKMGVEDTFHPTQVGIFFGDGPEQKEYRDPFFGGLGPDRNSCNACGHCMIGCPNGSKNTLDKNYLYFFEKFGGQIFSELTVTKIKKNGSGFEVDTQNSTCFFKRKGPTFKSKKVIFSAGALGTVGLLLKNQNYYQTLEDLPQGLGLNVRTNGESLLGATSFDPKVNMAKGIAIGAAIHPNKETKIEGVRYPSGSDFMRVLAVPLTGPGNWFSRPLKLIASSLINFPSIIRTIFKRDWAKSTLILLVMQSIETKMKLSWGRSIFHFFRPGLKGGHEGNPPPSYMPLAQEAGNHLADIIKGHPQNVVSEVLAQTPATAHILGGAVMGDDPLKSVVNKNHEIHNNPGLYICDASVIPCNLAVNPSLTITALAERFSSQFPISEGLEEKWEERKVFNQLKDAK